MIRTQVLDRMESKFEKTRPLDLGQSSKQASKQASKQES